MLLADAGARPAFVSSCTATANHRNLGMCRPSPLIKVWDDFMKDRKFKYQRPQNTTERLEAIYDELHESAPINNEKQLDTLKDHVVALLAHIRKIEQRKENEKEDAELSLRFTLGVFAFIASVLLFNGFQDQSDWEWLNNNRFSIRLWGVGLSAVFIGVLIERTSFIMRLWSFSFTKIITSIAVSALIIFCTGKASSLINFLFGVDASVFPYTRAFLTGLLVFQYLSPLLLIVVIFLISHSFNIIGYIKSLNSSGYAYTRLPLLSIAFFMLGSMVLMFSWHWINYDFSEKAIPAKIYRLAHSLDFNSRHSCTNIPNNVSVVFVGPDQSKVLVDINNVQTEDMESFINRRISDNVEIPKKFFFLPCQAEIRND